MRLKIHGPIDRVTGSCYELHEPRKNVRFLVDCGMRQGEHDAKEHNAAPFPFNASSLRFVVLTHAHIDHCGLIPLLYKRGFQGHVLCTEETASLAKLVLEDAAKHSGLYDQEDVDRIDWREPHGALFGGYCSLAKDLFVRFFRTGHILGAVSVQIIWGPPKGKQRRILFSGDLGPCAEEQPHLPLLRHRMTTAPSDYCVLESTYGDHERSRSEEDLSARLRCLEEEIHRAFDACAPLIIPCFAIGRTQDVLLDLHLLGAQRRLPRIPIYFDAKLAKKVCEVYADSLGRLIRRGVASSLSSAPPYPAWLGKGLFELTGLDHQCPNDRSLLLDALQEMLRENHAPQRPRRGGLAGWRRLWAPWDWDASDVHGGPAVIVTGGGMCDGGFVQNHLSRHLTDRRATVLLTGYAASKTVAGRLQALSQQSAQERAFITERLGLRESRLRCCDVEARVRRIHGYSAHADQRGLLQWLFMSPKGSADVVPAGRTVMITHGERSARSALEEAINARAKALQQRVSVRQLCPGEDWIDLA